MLSTLLSLLLLQLLLVDCHKINWLEGNCTNTGSKRQTIDRFSSIREQARWRMYINHFGHLLLTETINNKVQRVK